ncbi:hypothetical protein NCCP2716_26940 [Sporosarcina sp. NCCP-2716]|nr:hypothetical protein NCCP2716_26940 [Sporosarcina sp. NCCP-2716]
MALVLAGCIGEDYDFSPPAVTLQPADAAQQEQLAEANIEWSYDEKYNKKTDDIFALAVKQNKLLLTPDQRVQLTLDHGDFKLDGITIFVWQNDERVTLPFDEKDQSFAAPAEAGNYVVEVALAADKGQAQYVGMLAVE